MHNTDMHPQRLTNLVVDAAHLHVAQSNQQLTHACRVKFHRDPPVFRLCNNTDPGGSLAFSRGPSPRRLHPQTRRALLAAEDVAAVFVEPVQGEGGIRPVSDQVLVQLGELCRLSGTLLIVDEIQTGLGRAGRLVNYPQAASPAVVLFGKVLGGGLLPVAAAAFDSSRIPRAAADPVVHPSSYAAAPLAPAVGRAAIDVVSDSSFLNRIGVLSTRVSERLSSIAAQSCVVAGWRGRGLMFGIEFSSFEACGQTVLEAANRRLLTTFCLNDPRVLRLYPPANISDEELGELLDRLGAAVRATENWLGEGALGSDIS